MINGGESAYFQTDLLDFDAFLTIFSFCQGVPALLYLISPIAGQTGAGCPHMELLYISSGQ